MKTKKSAMLLMAVILVLPITAIAECESGQTVLGTADGNVASESCVNSEVAMVETEPVSAVSPSPVEEPNPNPNPASEGAEGSEGDNQGPIE